MEKNFEKRNIEYFTKVVEKIGLKVVPVSELYKIFSEVDKEMGIEVKNIHRGPLMTNKLIEVLGEKDLEIVVDEGSKNIGRQVPRWFSLKVKDEKELNNIKSDIISYFKRRAVLLSESKKKPRTRKSGGKVVTEIRKPFLRSLWNLLLKIRKEKSDTISFQRMRELTGKPFTSQILEYWQKSSSLASGGVVIDVKVLGNRKDRKIKFINLNNTIFKMYELMRLNFPDETFTWVDDSGTVLKKIPTKPVIKKETEQNLERTTNETEEAYLIYAVGGIIKENGGTRVYTDVLTTRLRTDFGINVVKRDVVEVLKKETKYFDLINYGESVKLRDENSWANIKKIYGPENYFKDFLARLGMSIEDVQKVVPDMKVELISKISENDGIYKITYDRTMHQRKELVRLFRTFRQNDKILNDTDLENDLQREIELIDARSYKDNIAYQIEKL